MSEFDNGADRRTVLLSGAALAAATALPTLALAADDLADFRKAIAAGHDAGGRCGLVERQPRNEPTSPGLNYRALQEEL